MFEKFKKNPKKSLKNQENTTIYQRPAKKIRIPLSHYIKQLLRWFSLKDEFGEDLIPEEININELFGQWSRTLILWVINVFLTGSLILLAVIPFYSIDLRLVPIIIFSFGIAYFTIIETLKEVVYIVKH
tara:strand:+ start:2984 stop:3370 length:387 start_codon:yes stop_codon:yes gene_type:complete